MRAVTRHKTTENAKVLAAPFDDPKGDYLAAPDGSSVIASHGKPHGELPSVAANTQFSFGQDSAHGMPLSAVLLRALPN